MCISAINVSSLILKAEIYENPKYNTTIEEQIKPEKTQSIARSEHYEPELSMKKIHSSI